MQDKTLLQRLPEVFVGLLILALLVYALVLVAVWWKQEKLLFVPTVLAQDHVFKIDTDVQERFIEVEGARLNALHLRLPKPKAVALFLHGNGGSLENWFVNTDFYRSMNVDLLMIDYRGYGKSSGAITSEAQLHSDVARTFVLLKSEYPALPVVLIGRSLGTGLASKLYSTLGVVQRPKLMILVSPFVSIKALAAVHFAWVPSVLLRYPMSSDLALAAIDPQSLGTVLLLHGDQDQLIPPENSQRLAALQAQIKVKVIRGAAHNDLQDFPDYVNEIKQAIASVAP